MGLSWLSASAPLSGITAKLLVFWKGVKRRGLNLCETWAFTSKRTDVHMTHYTSYNGAAGGSSQREASNQRKEHYAGDFTATWNMWGFNRKGTPGCPARSLHAQERRAPDLILVLQHLSSSGAFTPARWSSAGTTFCVCARHRGEKGVFT